MIALMAATEREARPLIELLAAEPLPAEPFAAWQAARGDSGREIRVVISGVGKVAAAAATANLLSRNPIGRLINFGVCGALADRDDLNPGALCQVITAVEGDRLCMGDRSPVPVPCHQMDAADITTADLVTVDRPVFDAGRRKALSALGQLVDMEGAAIARTAAWFGAPCTLLKGVSDAAGEGDRQRLQTKLDGVAADLATLLLRLLAV